MLLPKWPTIAGIGAAGIAMAAVFWKALHLRDLIAIRRDLKELRKLELELQERTSRIQIPNDEEIARIDTKRALLEEAISRRGLSTAEVFRYTRLSISLAYLILFLVAVSILIEFCTPYFR